MFSSFFHFPCGFCCFSGFLWFSLAFHCCFIDFSLIFIAARALGLDCGPMSGFDNDAVDKAFFADEPRHRSNFICAIGYGDRESIFARSPRPDFDKFNRID